MLIAWKLRLHGLMCGPRKMRWNVRGECVRRRRLPVRPYKNYTTLPISRRGCRHCALAAVGLYADVERAVR